MGGDNEDADVMERTLVDTPLTLHRARERKLTETKQVVLSLITNQSVIRYEKR